MRVFLDTNVLVAAFATRGLSADVVRAVISEHELVTSEVVLGELGAVLASKIGLPQGTVAAIDAMLRRYHVEPIPADVPDFPLRDPDDRVILAAAINARADLLVTGDDDLLSARDEIAQIRILNPREFWNLLRGN